MSIIGYIRVSTNKQSLSHQTFEIKKFARTHKIHIDELVSETISSRKKLKARKLGALLGRLKSGDILVACEISRLGRSLLEVMHILEVCLNKNCQVWTIKEDYRLGNDIQSKVMAFAFGLAAEIERNLISQRTLSSLAALKAKGRTLGRPYCAQTKVLKLSKNKRSVKKLLDKGFSRYKIAQLMDVHTATVYHFVERMGWFEVKVKKNKKN